MAASVAHQREETLSAAASGAECRWEEGSEEEWADSGEEWADSAAAARVAAAAADIVRNDEG